VTAFVVDASIAIKWVIEEDGTPAALSLRNQAKLIAPELLIAECANILWKKVRRDELSKDEALLAARLLQGADMELMPTRSLLAPATLIAIELDHPAYDCMYVALAAANGCRFVTADDRFLRKLRDGRGAYRDMAISLTEATASSSP
jgi:predicted nucleic acid-binding protein